MLEIHSLLFDFIVPCWERALKKNRTGFPKDFWLSEQSREQHIFSAQANSDIGWNQGWAQQDSEDASHVAFPP